MQRVDYTRTTTATVALTATANVGSTYYEPIDLATMVNYLKQNYGSVMLEDAMISTMIQASRYWVEEKTGRAIVRQTVVYQVSDDENPIIELTLPFYPFVTMTSVKRIDQEGTETDLVLNTDYYLRGLAEKTLQINRTWSTGIIGGMNYQDIRVTFEAGDAVNTSTPAPLKLAIMKMVAENYVNRENSVDWGINIVPMDVLKLIGPFMNVRI
jgi:uncharacterized phiE125 gp8 family phage protein